METILAVFDIFQALILSKIQNQMQTKWQLTTLIHVFFMIICSKDSTTLGENNFWINLHINSLIFYMFITP